VPFDRQQLGTNPDAGHKGKISGICKPDDASVLEVKKLSPGKLARKLDLLAAVRMT